MRVMLIYSFSKMDFPIPISIPLVVLGIHWWVLNQHVSKELSSP